MSRARVLIVNHTSRLGGAERVLLTFLSELKCPNFEVKLAAPSGPLLAAASELGIRCASLTAEDFRSTRSSISPLDVISSAAMFRSLLRISRSFRPDIILSNSIKAHVLGDMVALRLGIPLIIRLHDQIQTFSPIARLLMKGPLRRAALVSCVSESVAADVRRFLGNQSRLKVCYNGVSIEPVTLHQHFEQPRVVAAGWMFPWKGFDVFVQAMEIVAQHIDGWKFVIAGGPASDVEESTLFYEKLKRRVESSKWNSRFIFSGPYAKLEEVTCCPIHSIFVVPSQKPDPLPTVVLEAGALRLPVVATKLGGVTEMISNGATGILTEIDAESISKAVLSIIASTQKRLALGGELEKEVKAKFSVTNYVTNLIQDITSSISGEG